jgi:hypothetical protein
MCTCQPTVGCCVEQLRKVMLYWTSNLFSPVHVVPSSSPCTNICFLRQIQNVQKQIFFLAYVLDIKYQRRSFTIWLTPCKANILQSLDTNAGFWIQPSFNKSSKTGKFSTEKYFFLISEWKLSGEFQKGEFFCECHLFFDKDRFKVAQGGVLVRSDCTTFNLKMNYILRSWYNNVKLKILQH